MSDDEEIRWNAVPQENAAKFNPEDYAQYFDDFDPSDEQTIELLRTLWEITAAFARWGYGIDSVQFLAHALEGETKDDDKEEPRHDTTE